MLRDKRWPFGIQSQHSSQPEQGSAGRHSKTTVHNIIGWVRVRVRVTVGFRVSVTVRVSFRVRVRVWVNVRVSVRVSV